MNARIVGLHRASTHHFSKEACSSLVFIGGEGIEGDAHRGVTVKHRSRVRVDPTQPNLRQVHLIQSELFAALARNGHDIAPGMLGENITTAGLDLFALPRGTILHLGASVALEITGLRNPCRQIEDFQEGLLDQVLERSADGTLIRKAGIMSIVLTGGEARIGDTVRITLPPPPHAPLERV
jgi:MOSC domain-containing protein YiiM